MLSKRIRSTVNQWLTKRGCFSQEQIDAFIDYLAPMSPVQALSTAKWYAEDVVRVPEDQPKIDEAVQVARKAKVDPLQYASPMELIDRHKEYKLTEPPIDPDTLPELSNKTDLGYGVVIYNVQDDKVGQRAVRRLVNTHFGEDANPWCLLQVNKKGILTKYASNHWKEYNKIPKRVAFKDGKLCAFSASNTKTIYWWDRLDLAHSGIPLRISMPDDDLKRTADYELSSYGYLSSPRNIRRGNQHNGLFEAWSDEDTLRSKAYYTDGKLHGLCEHWHVNGQLNCRCTYNDGKLEGLYESWYENGQLEERCTYKDGEKNGLLEKWNEDGQLAVRCSYKDDIKHGLYESWYPDGQLKLRGSYVKDKEDGLYESWYPNGQLSGTLNYNEGVKEGLYESWYEGGQLCAKEYYNNDKKNGLCESWYGNGQLWFKENYKDGKLHGLSEHWHVNGLLSFKENYKDGKLHGLCEDWYSNGQLESRCTYKDGKFDGLCESWFHDGKIRARGFFKDGQLQKEVPSKAREVETKAPTKKQTKPRKHRSL